MTTTTTPALRAANLGVRFGAFRAVDEVSLNVPPGSRLALIGPNGAGKTTLVNLLTGNLKPTSGTVCLDSDDITHLPAHQRVRRGIVRTFQINALFPSLTPHEAVSLAICERDRLAKVWWRVAKHYPHVWDEAEHLLGTLGLRSVMETPTRQLAYGRQRLLEIALALATSPRILLLDEPAAGVPEGESDDVFDVIASLPSDLSVVFVEHDMDLVFRFAKRIAVLVAGSVLTEGTPHDIANDLRVREVYLGSTHVHAA
jgi:branched-chain amino acid transport system ATP-binding protein